tara:strand:- start:597 stop:1730 length:1134 start_codon:yes stop_codon:yes gene_type:complete
MGCHQSESDANEQIQALYASEVDESNSVTLVYGPPCGGKSTYVEQMAQPGDLILCSDRLHQALSGLEAHNHDQHITHYVRTAYDSVLRDLQKPQPKNTRAFILAGAPTVAQRNEFASTATATHLVYADRETCHERAKEAGRPEDWHRYIDRWHDTYEPDSPERSYDMPIERRTANESVELREDGESLVATGYASVFNRLSQNLGGFVEQVDSRAFNSTIKQADVRALFNHEPDHLLGRSSTGTLRMNVDDTGLRYEIDLPNTSLGKDVAELLKRGDISGSSFGFRVISDDWGQTDDGYPLRTLTEVALRDLGPVTFAAYESTSASLRSLADTTEIDLEVLIQAAEDNNLRDLIFPPETNETEPVENHSIVRRSWGIR